VRVPLRLEEPAMVQVEILDARARLVYHQRQPIDAGVQLLDLPATAFPQAGVYFWRIQAGRDARSGKMVKQ